jgi:hypothetical protein
MLALTLSPEYVVVVFIVVVLAFFPLRQTLKLQRMCQGRRPTTRRFFADPGSANMTKTNFGE